MLGALVLAAAAGVPQCWNVYDAALRHSAEASHPPYVSYDERVNITEDEQPLVFSRIHVDYRDDGIARVLDERFNFDPIVTEHAEPGPPELGPYGKKRAAWLPQNENLPIIADVRSAGSMTCTLAGAETYKGRQTYHLVFAGLHASDHPSLKGMWVDTATNEVWKLVVSGPVAFTDDPNGSHSLADFQVEFARFGRYMLVNHVVWSYRRREYSQYATYFAEYTFGGFSFPTQLPASYFSERTADVQ